MTIDEAIALGKAAADDMRLQGMPRFAEAVRLGIEALKRLGELRHYKHTLPSLLLPGETEEQEQL